MAYQTGVISYRGSFKSIRHWKYVNDPKIYAGEKGGANRDLILNNPVFRRTRENMSEFKGCAVAVKTIRRGLLKHVIEHADTHFTARLMKTVKMINLMDGQGTKGSKAICFSQNRGMLKTLTLHKKRKIDFQLKRCITKSHPESRAEATITVNEFNPGPTFVPGKAQFYRVVNHLSIVSDVAYSENMLKYVPLSPLSATSALVYSDYAAVNTPLSVALKAAFPSGTVLSESDTMLQCIGVEFYIRSGVDGYVPYSTGSMMVYDVF